MSIEHQIDNKPVAVNIRRIDLKRREVSLDDNAFTRSVYVDCGTAGVGHSFGIVAAVGRTIGLNFRLFNSVDQRHVTDSTVAKNVRVHQDVAGSFADINSVLEVLFEGIVADAGVNQRGHGLPRVDSIDALTDLIPLDGDIRTAFALDARPIPGERAARDGDVAASADVDARVVLKALLD